MSLVVYHTKSRDTIEYMVIMYKKWYNNIVEKNLFEIPTEYAATMQAAESDGEDVPLAFDYDEDAPTYDAYQLLTGNVYRSNHSRESLLYQRFSQTPLSPSLLYELGNIEYGRAVMNELDGRLHQTALETGLDSDSTYFKAILDEIAVESRRRIEGNDHAGRQLLNLFAASGNGTTVLSPGDATLIWRNRTGDANMAETGDLLLRYPVIGSVEAMKHTAPLQWSEVANSEIFINQHLDEFKHFISSPSRVHITEFDKHDVRRNLRTMGPACITGQDDGMPEIVYGTKENLAEVTNGDVVIELIKKQTYILLPAGLPLTNVLPSIRRGRHPVSGEMIEVNMQPIATTAYWRVKPDASMRA